MAQRVTGPEPDDAADPGPPSAGPVEGISPPETASGTTAGAASTLDGPETDEFFRQIFETSVDGMLLTAPDGRTFRANRSACELLGRTEAELQQLGRAGVLDFTQPNAAEMLQTRSEHGRVRQEVTLLRADGTALACEVSSSTYTNSNGEPRAVVILRDISARRRADELRREAAARLSLATEASNTGLWDWNLRTNEVYYSATWKRQLGYGDDELDNGFETWRSRLHPDDLQRALAATETYLKDPSQHYEIDFRPRHRDGSYRWILSKASLLSDGEGRPARLLGSHIDLTERKAAEAAILESERRFRSAIEASPIPIALTDRDELIEYINPRFTQTLGYTLEDLKSVEDWWPLAYPDPEYRAWVMSLWQSRSKLAAETGTDPAPIEAIMCCKDGSTRTIVAHAARLEDAERPKRLAMFIDVTEQRLLERQVMQAVTREQQRLGMNLHDGLGQELTALSLLLTAAATSLPHANAGAVERELMRLATVARHCLDTARSIAHGLSPIEPEPGGFERALEQLAEATARAGRVEVRLDMSGLGAGRHVVAPLAEPLFRIVQEAVTNAVKHGRATQIDIHVERARSQLFVSVTDNGSGVAAEKGGSGFGLRIMRYRAEAIGGHLELERGVGGGTVVRCICPARSVDPSGAT